MKYDGIVKKLNRAIIKGINNHCFGTQNGYVMKCHEKSEYDNVELSGAGGRYVYKQN